MFNINQSNQTIKNIDKFFDTIDRGLLIFKEGVRTTSMVILLHSRENLVEMENWRMRRIISEER